jgi:hypothetical protein
MNAAQMAKMNIGETVWEVQTVNGPPKLVRWYILRKDARLMWLGRSPRGASNERGLPVSLRQDNYYERTPLEAAAEKLLRAEARLEEAENEVLKAQAYKKDALEFFEQCKDNVGNLEVGNAKASVGS